MAEDEQNEKRVWDFIPLDQYKLPGGPAAVRHVRKGVRELLRKLAGKEKKKESPLESGEDLLALSGQQLKSALPVIEWQKAADQFNTVLEPWLGDEKPLKPVVFYLAPPWGGKEELLSAWAEQHEIAVVSEPSQEAILGNEGKWFKTWPKEGPWLLPRLEKVFLRQAEGLDLVRELFSRVLSGSMGKGIIGCDSWAWQFLQQVWLGRPSFTLCSQAFDAERLKELFSSGIPSFTDSEVPFRQADNGIRLLTSEDGEKETSSPEPFWRKLAAYSRGNIGVAKEFWKRALRTLPEKEQVKDSSEDQRRYRRTVWVTSWNEMDLPVIPGETGETAMFVLHALLLHGGLDAERLATILPSDRAAIIEALLFLREAELVIEQEGQWRVSAYGYPAVRGLLLGNDYLCDSF